MQLQQSERSGFTGSKDAERQTCWIELDAVRRRHAEVGFDGNCSGETRD